MLRWFRRRHESTRPDQRPPSPQDGNIDQAYIREAERRRLRRLLQQQAELQYDREQALEAQKPSNRWTARVAELEAAIAQTEADIKQWDQPQRASSPPPELPPVPIQLIACDATAPATLTLAIGAIACTWHEAIDWAERGHQLAPAQLVRDEVDLTPLFPTELTEDQRTTLRERLLASLDLLAAAVLRAIREQQAIVLPPLSSLVRPCPICGGWRDLHDHCSDCLTREWHRQQLVSELRRLRKERDAVLSDMARIRDRLPIIERQLHEVEADIAALQAKGVTLEH